MSGGTDNAAGGTGSTVPGGDGNVAAGSYSFAAGRHAKAESSGGTAHDGAVVFGDSSGDDVRSVRADQFVAQAGGGVTLYSASDLSTGVELPAGGGSWSSLSARDAKTHVRPVDPGAVLDAVVDLDVSTWEYDSEEGATHLGPMAEDFHAAFGLGGDERRISAVDADGVALAAIQGLSAALDRTAARSSDLAADLEAKTDRIEDLERENERLRERLRSVEDRLGDREAGAPSPPMADD